MATPGTLGLRNKAQTILSEGGKALLHALAPNDFEYYACSLRVDDSMGNIKHIFNFPVMPSAMMMSRIPLATIKKTEGGYVDLISDTFNSTNITLSGTFGRKFRLLLNQDLASFNTSLAAETAVTTDKAKKFLKGGTLDLRVKTGYGAIKLMDKILRLSTQVDEHKAPYTLFFFNYAFNEAHVVENVNFSSQQSLENNITWNYSMELRTLGPATGVIGVGNKADSIAKAMAWSAVQKATNIALAEVTTVQGGSDAIKSIF